MDKGSFREAFSLIVNFEVNRPDHLFKKIALMVDAGVALRDIKCLEYSCYLLTLHTDDILAVSAYAPYVWFNQGNLHSNILVLKEIEKGARCWYDRSLSLPARQAYGKALACVGNDKQFKSRILSAHACLLAGLGREQEAAVLYHKSFTLDNGNTDAVLGRIDTLTRLAGTAPELEKILLQEAGGKLVSLENRSTLNRRGEELKTRIAERLGTDNFSEPKYPRNKLTIHNERTMTMVEYFLTQQLYLSPCTGCLGCERAIGDKSVISSSHAVVGGKIPGSSRKMAILTGRLIERYRALRTALFNHHHKANAVPDEIEKELNIAGIKGWKPLPPETVSLLNSLSGVGAMLEGMAVCIALYLDMEIIPPLELSHILGTPYSPAPCLKNISNPALHAFWDTWVDGMEGIVQGVELVELFSPSMSTSKIEQYSLDANLLTDSTVALLRWLGYLITCLICMADRNARNDMKDPPLWPLHSFISPIK